MPQMIDYVGAAYSTPCSEILWFTLQTNGGKDNIDQSCQCQPLTVDFQILGQALFFVTFCISYRIRARRNITVSIFDY